jgi:hypothetical protein
MQSHYELSDARAYRGGKSLHLHGDAYDGSINGYVDAEVNADNSGPIHFTDTAALRVFVYLPSPIVTGSFQLLSLGDITVLVLNGQPELTQAASSVTLPTDRWFCLELRSQPADLGNEQILFIDEAEVLRDDVLHPVLDGFGLKLVRTQQASPPLDVWFDELVVNDQPILCDR